jgi:hypothetical protein
MFQQKAISGLGLLNELYRAILGYFSQFPSPQASLLLLMPPHAHVGLKAAGISSMILQ